MSLFMLKGSSEKSTQPWSFTWTPGDNLANFFALYDYHSLADVNGDATISSATSIATTLDGPIQVARFRDLTVNATLTASLRCRGLIVLSDSLTMGASGEVSMTGRGAAGSKTWAVDRDIVVPASITFTGENTSFAQFLAWIRSTGYCIFDPTLYACPPPGMGDVQCDWATWASYGETIISAAGCGSATPPKAASNAQGQTGNAGTNGGTGSGGGGGCGMNPGCAQAAGPGRTWGGGSASGGNSVYTGYPMADWWGGVGGQGGPGVGSGGAGNPSANNIPGSNGTGGVLIKICRGDVTLYAGHKFTANGMPGEPQGSNTYSTGGGSGAGSVSLFYGWALTGSQNLNATGGAGGTGAYIGGAGGAGSTQSNSFAAMGWS